MLDRTYPLARKLLFRLDAERAHHWSLSALRTAERLGILDGLSGDHPPAAPIECMGLTFPNQLGLAAGLDKEGNAIDAFGRLGFGFIEIGTITPRPQTGNPTPRLFRLLEHEAIINRMGFNNPGIAGGVANVRKSKTFRGVIGFNIGKNKDTPNEQAIDDYLTCLRERGRSPTTSQSTSPHRTPRASGICRRPIQRPACWDGSSRNGTGSPTNRAETSPSHSRLPPTWRAAISAISAKPSSPKALMP